VALAMVLVSPKLAVVMLDKMSESWCKATRWLSLVWRGERGDGYTVGARG
jgi:hypothetical protein